MNNQEPLRITPHSIEAEQSVLGAIMLAVDAFDVVAEKGVRPEHFYNRSHAIVFKAMVSIVEKCRNVDLVTLEGELDSNGDMEQAGGLVYLGDLLRNTPSAANVSTYCDILIERAQKRALIGVGYEIAEMGFARDGVEIKEIVAAAESKVMAVGDSVIGDIKDMSAKGMMTRYHSYMEALVNRKGGLAGISTGLIDLDKKTQGLKNSDMIILAARPSMGKTTLALNMVQTEMMSGGYPLVFSLEMPEEQIINKFVSSIAKVEISKVQAPNTSEQGITDEEWTRITGAWGRITQSNLMIDDRSGLTPADMEIVCGKYVKEYGRRPSLIMIDYIQLMRISKAENRTQEISEISRQVKALAKKMECPVIALSQLNRSLENRADKRPINSDLRESGQIEQDADLILFIYRDEVYNKNSPNKGLAELIIGKQRNGPIGMVGSTFMGQFSRFDNMVNREFCQDEPKMDIL